MHRVSDLDSLGVSETALPNRHDQAARFRSAIIWVLNGRKLNIIRLTQLFEPHIDIDERHRVLVTGDIAMEASQVRTAARRAIGFNRPTGVFIATRDKR